MCWSNARPLSYIRFLIHRRFRIIFARIIRTRVFILTAGILKGPPCFEYAEVRGAGSPNEDCRQQPPATDHVHNLQGRVLHLQCFYHIKGKIVTQSGQSTHLAYNPHILHITLCALHPSCSPHLVYFLFQLGLYVCMLFLYCLFLSGSPKRAPFRRGNFLTLSKKWVFRSHDIINSQFLIRGPIL